MWESLRDFLEQDAAAEDSMVRDHLANMFVEVGRASRRATRRSAPT